MYPPSHDVIEVFNCPICSFSDTNLDAVAHHVRRHIKPEPDSVKVKVPNRKHGPIEGTNEGLRHSLIGSNEKGNSLEREPVAIEAVSYQRKFPSLEHSKRKNINDCVLAIAKAPGLGRQEAWSNGAGSSKARHAGGDLHTVKRVRHGSEQSNPQLSTFSILQPTRLVAPSGLVPVNCNVPAPSSLIQGPILPVVVPAPLYNPRATLLEMYPAHPTYQLSTQFASQHHFPTNTISVDFASLSPNRVRSVYEEVYSSIGNRTAKDPSVRSLPKPGQQIFLDSSARMATTHDQSHFVAPDATQKLRPERPLQQLRYPPHTGHVLYRPLPVKFFEKQMANEISVLVQSTEASASASASQYAIVSRAEALSQARAPPKPGPVLVGSSSLPCQLLYTQVQSMSLPQTLPGNSENGFPVIIPNSGTVIVNNNLMQGAIGDVSLDQLAGLLVVPLKRTSSVATQTDMSSGLRSETGLTEEVASASTQTDVLMRHIIQVNPKADSEVFAEFASLDDVFECHLCGDVLTHEVNYDEHLVRQHAYDCEICLTTLNDQRSYTQHVYQCGANAVKLQCDACFEIFGTIKKLNYHRIKSHQHTMRFRCGVCHLPFESHASVSEHVAAHSKESVDLRCQYCSKMFRAHIALSKHVTRHKAVSVLYECQLCWAQFANSMALQNHVQEHGESLIGQGSERAAGEHSMPVSVREKLQPSSVGGCDFLLPSRESTEVGKVASPARCDRCFCEFPSGEALNMHTCSCLAVSQSTETALGPIVDLPSEPGSKFTNERGRVQTTPAFTSVRSFSNQHLDIKEGILSEARSLKDLDSERMSLSVMQCPDCSEIFTSRGDLCAHLKERHGVITASSVLGSPKLVYSACDDKFRSDHELNIRQGQKPFKCTLCPLSFQYSGEVIWHMRDHEKDNPIREPSIGDTAEKICRSPASSAPRRSGKASEDFGIILCKLCLVEFPEIEKLNRHMEMFHSGKRFACDSCHATFMHPSQLEWHRDTCVKKQRGELEHRVERKQHDVSSRRFELADALPDPPEKSALSSSRHARKAFGAYSCEDCHETFCEEVLYQEHARECCGNYKEYLCHVCGDAFNATEKYHQHMAGHFSKELKGPVDTPTRKEFSPVYVDGLRQGMVDGCGDEGQHGQLKRTSSVASHRCESCFDEFASFTALKRHSRDYHHTPHERLDDSASDAVSPVVILDRSMESPPELKRVDSTAASLDATADLFGMSASSQESFLQEEPPFDYKTGEYFCTICHKTTRSTTGMKTHYGRCHGIWGKRSTHHHQANVDAPDGSHGTDAPSWSCNFCSKGSATYHGLRTHIMRMHKDLVDRCDDEPKPKASVPPVCVGVGESSTPADSASYTCTECQSSFPSGNALRLHFAQAHQLMLSDEQVENCKSRSSPERRAENGAAGSGNGSRSANTFVKYRCPHCKASFHTVKAIRVHTLEAHEVLMSKKDVIRSKEWFKAGASAYPRRLAKMFINRRKGHDLIGKHAPCDRCGRVFGNYRALFTHYRQAHRMMSANSHVYRKPSKTEILSAPSTLPDGMQGANEGLLAGDSPKTRSGGPEVESSAPSQYLSPLAPSATPSADVLVNNLKVATITEPESATGNDLPVPSIDCPVCGKVFYQHKSLMAHLCKAHHVYKESYADFWPHGMPVLPRESSFCPICGKEYVDERAMRIHIFKAHKMHHRDLQGAGLSHRDPLRAASAVEPSEIQVKGSLVNTQEFDMPPCGMTDSDATFTCPRCATDFVNRRALTTHLCRMHGYKRHHINRLFGEPSKAYGEAMHVDSGHHDGRDQTTEANQVLASTHRRDSGSASFLRDEECPVSFVAIDRGAVAMDSGQPTSAQKLLSCNKRKPRYSEFGRKAKYACPRCGNAFVSPHAVRVHVGRAHGKGLVSKKLCIEKYSEASDGNPSPYSSNRGQVTAVEPKAIDILSTQQARGYFADLPATKEPLNTLSSSVVRFPGHHISYSRGCYEHKDEVHGPATGLSYPVTMKTDSGDKQSIACMSNGGGTIRSPRADLVNGGVDDNYNKRRLGAAVHRQDSFPDEAAKLVACNLSSS